MFTNVLLFGNITRLLRNFCLGLFEFVALDKLTHVFGGNRLHRCIENIGRSYGEGLFKFKPFFAFEANHHDSGRHLRKPNRPIGGIYLNIQAGTFLLYKLINRVNLIVGKIWDKVLTPSKKASPRFRTS